MTTPVLVLRPPERRGKQIALSADLLIGDSDSVTVSALIGPETQAWVQREGKRVLGGLGVRLDRAKKLLERHVQFAGDWRKFGDLGALSFDMVRETASSGRLSMPPSSTREAAARYLALIGRMGGDAQAAAEAELAAIEAAAENDDAAHYDRYLIDVAHSVTNGDPPEDAAYLDMCRALDSVAGGACCDDCAKGHECAGPSCSDGVTVAYDAEDAILMPDETPVRIAGRASDALGYKAYRKVAPKITAQEAMSRIHSLVGNSGALLPAVRPGIPPGIVPWGRR